MKKKLQMQENDDNKGVDKKSSNKIRSKKEDEDENGSSSEEDIDLSRGEGDVQSSSEEEDEGQLKLKIKDVSILLPTVVTLLSGANLHRFLHFMENGQISQNHYFNVFFK